MQETSSTTTTPDRQAPAENSIDERDFAQDSKPIATAPPTEEIEPPTDNTVPQPTEEHRQKLIQALALRVKGMNGEEFAKAIRDWAEVNGDRRPCGFVIYAKQQVKDSKGDSMWQVICYQSQQDPPEQELKYTIAFHAAGDIFAIFEQ